MGGATGAVAATGELTRKPWAGVDGDAAVTGTATAAELAAELAEELAAEFAATGVPAAPLTGLPWLGVPVNTTAAAAAATARSVIAPVTIPVRKLTSSSRALMAARTPGREPAVR